MKIALSHFGRKTYSPIGLLVCIVLAFGPKFSFSQNSTLLSVDDQQKPGSMFIKSFTGKYYAEKVYLNLIVNGVIENTTICVERSIDGTNFETVGRINLIGSAAAIDLLYSFTDEQAMKLNAYYRLVSYDSYSEPSYSDVVTITPVVNTVPQNNSCDLQTNKN